MKKSHLVGAVCFLFLLAHSYANAYSIQVSGQTLSNLDQDVVHTNISEANGATALNFDTGTIDSIDIGGSARSAASANLATGELKIFAESTHLQVASAGANFADALTISLPEGMVSSQLTAYLSIDGTVTGSLNGGALPQNLQISSVRGNDSDSLSLHDFTSSALLSATITIQDGDVVNLFASLGGATGLDGYSLIDLSNTGTVSLELEDGVTFSSESGVFLSAVPVPAAVWLFGSGLLGLIGIARRKKAA